MLKWVVYKGYVRPAFLYESEAFCLKESQEFCKGLPDR